MAKKRIVGIDDIVSKTKHMLMMRCGDREVADGVEIALRFAYSQGKVDALHKVI